MYLLEGRNVLLCVGGGIAAYKSAEIIRALRACGAVVQVAMTPAALEFITPLTLQAVSGRSVATNLLDAGEESTIGHIDIAAGADVVLVAPATADLVARMAHGMANDIVTAALLATRAPVVVAPAMNTAMLEHPAVQESLDRLVGWDYHIVEPDVGELACGTEGRGRLPDPPVLLQALAAALVDQDMSGLRVTVSAGPTCEPIDPVRFISNRSSGRMGYALAAAALRRGADVTLVSGPVDLPVPDGAAVVDVETAAEMKEAVEGSAVVSDLVAMVAAVADFRPADVAGQKIKNSRARQTLELEPTADILAGLADLPGERVVVGFAAETESLREHAAEKLARKRIDLVVANDVSAEGCGFGSETNAALLIDRDGAQTESGLVSKDRLADMIWDRALALPPTCTNDAT